MRTLLTRFRYGLLWLCRTIAPYTDHGIERVAETQFTVNEVLELCALASADTNDSTPFGADHDLDRINIHLLALAFWFMFLGLIGLGL